MLGSCQYLKKEKIAKILLGLKVHIAIVVPGTVRNYFVCGFAPCERDECHHSE